MWMALVVILEPRRQLRQDGFRIRSIVNIHVVSLEGFDKRFGHAVGLRASNRREAGNEAEGDRKIDGVMRPIATAVVREPLHRMRQSAIAEASLDTLHHQIADHLPADTPGAGAPGYDLSI